MLHYAKLHNSTARTTAPTSTLDYMFILSQSELEMCEDEEKRRELEKEMRECDEVNSVDTKQL